MNEHPVNTYSNNNIVLRQNDEDKVTFKTVMLHGLLSYQLNPYPTKSSLFVQCKKYKIIFVVYLGSKMGFTVGTE